MSENKKSSNWNIFNGLHCHVEIKEVLAIIISFVAKLPVSSVIQVKFTIVFLNIRNYFKKFLLFKLKNLFSICNRGAITMIKKSSASLRLLIIIAIVVRLWK